MTSTTNFTVVSTLACIAAASFVLLTPPSISHGQPSTKSPAGTGRPDTPPPKVDETPEPDRRETEPPSSGPAETPAKLRDARPTSAVLTRARPSVLALDPDTKRAVLASLRPEHTTLLDTMRHLEIKMQIHEDNLANVHTPGFKAAAVQFRSGPTRTQGLENSAEHVAVGTGSRIAAVTTTIQQGGLRSTGRRLDIAIRGAGFLQLLTKEGAVAYTRNGSLQINAEGRLASHEGMTIYPEIALPGDLLELTILSNGLVTGRTESSPDSATQFGQLQLARFADPTHLQRRDSSSLRATRASGKPLLGFPSTAGFGKVHMGFLERANVEPTAELLEIRAAKDHYNAIKKVLLGS